MPRGLESHTTDCPCPACTGRRQGGPTKNRVARLHDEVWAWLLSQPGGTAQAIERLVRPHIGRNYQDALEMWHRQRNVCEDDQILAIDAEGARSVGLPTLAAISELAQAALDGKPRLSATELAVHLAELAMTARGEGNARAERLGLKLGIPGISHISPEVVL